MLLGSYILKKEIEIKGSLRKRAKSSRGISLGLGRDPATGKRLTHFKSVTVHKHHRIVFESLRFGVKQCPLIRNVAEAVTPLHGHSKKPGIMRANVLNQILYAAKKTQYYALFFIKAYTGLRRGELLGLSWCDIDLNNSKLSVVQTLQQLRNGQYILR
jgi:integrase